MEESKYKEGDIVVARINPQVKLLIRRYIHDIYYCKIKEHPEMKELVYFERELEASASNE